MKIKKIILTSFLIAFTAFSLNASGAGFQLGLFPSLKISEDCIQSSDFDINATGTVRCSRIPLVFGAGILAGFKDSAINAGFSAFSDWWIIDSQIENTWNIFSGFGLGTTLKSNFSDSLEINLGPRFFTGMNWLFWDNYLELYIQQNINPVFSKDLKNKNSESSLKMYFPFETGLRFHF